MKQEFKVIADLLPNNTRVLDVGCGDGSLMSFLVKEKNIETDKGHDSFLLDELEFLKTLKGFIDSMYEKFKK